MGRRDGGRVAALPGAGWRHLFTAHQPVVLIDAFVYSTPASGLDWRVFALYAGNRRAISLGCAHVTLPPLPAVCCQLAGKERLLTRLEVERQYKSTEIHLFFKLLSRITMP